MFNWSVSIILKFLDNEPLMYASLAVASLNMLIQILFSMAFGEKSVLKLGGKR